MEAATSAGDDLHANSSIKDEIRQEDLCVPTQEEISFAELRSRGSLLQDSIVTDAIKCLFQHPPNRQLQYCLEDNLRVVRNMIFLSTCMIIHAVTSNLRADFILLCN